MTLAAGASPTRKPASANCQPNSVSSENPKAPGPNSLSNAGTRSRTERRKPILAPINS